MSWTNRLESWTTATGPLRGLALFRIVTGFMVWRHWLTFVNGYVDKGFYRNRLFVPYTEGWYQPSEAVYVLLLVVAMASAIFIILGWKTRSALLAVLVCTVLHLSLNQFWYRHNRYFFVLALLLLLVSPCHRDLAMDARKTRGPGDGTLWSGWLIRLQLTLIYLASASSKLLDPDWRSGGVLADRGRIAVQEMQSWSGFWNSWPAFTHGAMDWLWNLGIQISGNAFLWKVLTAQALCSEYFLALFAWHPRTRRMATWWAVIFHGFIELRYSVLVFSYLSIAVFYLAVAPERENRVMVFNSERRRHRLLAWLVQRFDWLHKIRLQTAKTGPIRVQDKDGSWYRGWMALAILGNAMVLSFPLAYPVTWLRFFNVGKTTIDDDSNKWRDAAPARPWWLFPIILLLLGYLGFILNNSINNRISIHGLTQRLMDLAMFVFITFLLANTRLGLLRAANPSKR